MHCQNCGNSLVTKGRFSPYCGNVIPEDMVIKIDSRQEVLDHARVQEEKEKPAVAKEQEKTKRRMGYFSVIIVFIVAFVVLAIYFEHNLNVKKTAESTYESRSSGSLTLEDH